MVCNRHRTNFVPVYARKKMPPRWLPHSGSCSRKPATVMAVQEYMQISPNPSTHTNITYCFLATGVEKISEQHLEDTESLSVHLLTLAEVKELLQKGEIKQALMAAPLWKYIAEKGL